MCKTLLFVFKPAKRSQNIDCNAKRVNFVNTIEQPLVDPLHVTDVTVSLTIARGNVQSKCSIETTISDSDRVDQPIDTGSAS